MLLSDASAFSQISILISGTGMSLQSVSSEFLLLLPSSDSCPIYIICLVNDIVPDL